MDKMGYHKYTKAEERYILALGKDGHKDSEIKKRFKKKYGADLSSGKIYRMLHPKEYKKAYKEYMDRKIIKAEKDIAVTTKPKKKTHKLERVFEKCTYLVYLKDGGVFGYDTIDEVKQFVINSGIIGNVCVFKKAEVKINYNIEIK